MAGFVDGFKKAWNGVKSAGSSVYDAGNYIFSGKYADDFADSDVFPYRRFEELAAIPEAEMTKAQREEYEKLQPQITKSAEGFVGTLSVVGERGVKATGEAIIEVSEGVGRGFKDLVDENSPLNGITSWISENWQLVLAGIIGIAGMFSGGFIGTIATAGAALLAGNGLAQKLTGKSLVDMGSGLIGGFTKDKSEPQVSVVKDREAANIAKSNIPSMEELAKASGIDYKTNHVATHPPKAGAGFVERLVKGAEHIGISQRYA